MKQILLAAVAAVALSFPAMAQNHQSSQPPSQTKMQAGQRINPMTLSKRQISQIQRALDKKGFNARKVDGIWGPETASALRNFQRKNDINAHGHLTRQTLAKLGVNWSGQNRQQAAKSHPSATTGSGSESIKPKRMQNGTKQPMQHQTTGAATQSGSKY